MRSRYSAFAVGDSSYLVDTYHSSTRPANVTIDPEVRWMRLDIDRVERGGPFDTEGVVAFTAHYRANGVRSSQHESSRFVRENGRWYYVDAID